MKFMCLFTHFLDALMRQLVLRATAMDEQKKLSQLQATLDEVS